MGTSVFVSEIAMLLRPMNHLGPLHEFLECQTMTVSPVIVVAIDAATFPEVIGRILLQPL